MIRRFIVLVVAVSLLALASGVAEASGLVHVVVPGDNLSRIAARYGVSVNALVAANNIWNPNRIYVGQVLVIPTGYYPPPAPPPPPSYPPPQYPPYGIVTYYTVQPRDTLAGIARYFGTTVQAIASANGIYNPNYVYVGQVLAIPRQPTIYAYYVQYGDTLSRIAARYGTSVGAIASYNGLYNPNHIWAGMLLQIPV